MVRVTSLETNAASGSSGPDSARSWNMLGQSNGSTPTKSPGSLGHPMTRSTRRRLDTFTSPEDEHARSAVSLRFPCEQFHTGITNWINNFWENQTFQSLINLSEFIAKQVPCRPDSYSKQEPNVKTLWPDIKMMVSPMKLTFPSAAPKQLSRFDNSNQLKTERSESNLRLCGEFWPISDGDDEGAFIVPALDARSQVLSIKDRKKRRWKTCFQTCSFWKWTLVYSCCT